MDDRHIKAEPGTRDRGNDDASVADPKPSYKSWKKKYRKMRLQFDQRMQQSEDLHREEQNALRTAKRLAIENDRLVDLLLDINESPQIPFERRFDLDLDADDDETDDEESAAQKPSKSLRRLIAEVPHNSFSDTVDQNPEVLEEIQPKDPDVYPTAFLTGHEVDTYLAEVDSRLGLKTKSAVPPPTQPSVHPNTTAANFALRNPTSVYNWLRKHAPKTFLQDLEKDKKKDHDKYEKAEGGSSRRKSGAARVTKRQSTASRKEKEVPESMDWDDDHNAGEKNMGSIRGKRKRDDDGGYRPKGGSSRPAKKRKSRDLGSGSSKVAFRKSTN